METNKKILGKINTQRCSVILMVVHVEVVLTSHYLYSNQQIRISWRNIFPTFSDLYERNDALLVLEEYFPLVYVCQRYQ
jgi:hypothetical protein